MSIPLNFVWTCLPAIVAMLAISAAYFASNKTPSSAARVAAAAHGFLGFILLAGAIVVWRLGGSSGAYALPYTGLFLLPVASIVSSFFLFRGNTLIHLFQVPNTLSLLWAWFVGGMAITNDWL